MDQNRITKYVNEFISGYQNYKKYWNYEDGCVLIGAKGLYEATGEKVYLDFILDYLEMPITEDGQIQNYELQQYNIDSINTGKILFFAFDQTGKDKYKKAADFIWKRLQEHPRCQCGNFWHKEIYPNQIWLDGLYMAQPFYMEYETRFNKKENYNDILSQFRNVRKFLYNEEKKLYYHAFDEAKIQPWCNKETGCSPNFWLRSMGWYLMALIDVIDVMSEEIYEIKRELRDLFLEAVKGILNYQDKTSKLFYQVIDREDVSGNYLETSGTAMIAYAIMKGVNTKILSEENYLTVGRDIFENLTERNLRSEEGGLSLHGICHVAGLGPGEKRDGSVDYYLSEKVVCDDAKGSGPYMMAYAQWLMMSKKYDF